jgi:hypothetical protein
LNQGFKSENNLKDDAKCNIFKQSLKQRESPSRLRKNGAFPPNIKEKGDLVYHFEKIDYVIELKWIDYDGDKSPARSTQTVKNKPGRIRSMLKIRL